MRVVRDMAAGSAPVPFPIIYNGDLDSDSSTTRYKGSLVKMMDYDDVDNGVFMTFAGSTTAMENVCGILEEEHTASYLPNDGTYATKRLMMTPVFPTSVIRARYGEVDAAGTATTDTSGTASAASTTFTITITTADYMIGGWIYFLTGDNADYLHYIDDNSTTTCTFRTAVTNAVVAADTFLVILPPLSRLFDLDATYTGIKSEIDDGSRGDALQGIEHWISAPGIGMERLNPEKHDGIKVSNAKFYHDFTIPSPSAGGNLWIMGPATS